MAPIGLTMIARGAAKTLGDCLESVKDYLDPIVIVLAGRPFDNTEEVALRYTDHVFWHDGEELEDGGTADFAAARNASLQHFAALTGPDAWFLWLDADDTVDHPERLGDMVRVAQEKKSQGVWLPYMYAFLKDGSCTTLFDRERLMYDPTNFRWQNRVHEIVVPRKQIHWTASKQVVVRHNHEAGGSRSTRNLTLLHMMRQENPDDKRVLFYLGHQHFANGEWEKAAVWYDRYVRIADNKLEQWQAYIYMAKALRNLERLDEATAAGLAAIGLFPDWRDGYFDLAETYAYRLEWENCLLMAQIGRERDVPSRLLFVNPLDEVGYNVGMFEEVSLFQLGKLDEALAKVQELRSITDSPHLETKEYTYKNFSQVRDRGEAWLQVLDGQSPERVVELARAMGKEVFTIPEIRTAVHGARLTLRRREKGRRVAFFCGPSLEHWTPKSLNEGGIGGSETATVEIARRFAADHWKVDVFNDCGRGEGEHEGVCYWHHERFVHRDPYDLLVSWRQPLLVDAELGAKRTWLWAHDLNLGDRLTPERAAKFERILGVSSYHAEYLRLLYDFLPEEKVDFVPNGIGLQRFAKEGIVRQRHKVVWTSSPDRGLDVLVSLWPSIREIVPDAELHVFYGFGNFDRLAKQVKAYALFVDEMRAHMNKPGIVERGRLGQAELAEELLSAAVWAYPTSFLETFCIASVEAMAAGVPVLAAGVGALPTTVGEAGILVPGHARSDGFMHRFLGCLYALLLDEDTWQRYHLAGPTRAKELTWDKSYEKWRALVGE